mmetsp:Transcript_37895/g.49887  ORF Transcript_37895/g.49887 Transcript_37895/m.49887 type:complete len:156 (-) Transcript_37895:1545-2012(-)
MKKSRLEFSLDLCQLTAEKQSVFWRKLTARTILKLAMHLQEGLKNNWAIILVLNLKVRILAPTKHSLRATAAAKMGTNLLIVLRKEIATTTLLAEECGALGASLTLTPTELAEIKAVVAITTIAITGMEEEEVEEVEEKEIVFKQTVWDLLMLSP